MTRRFTLAFFALGFALVGCGSSTSSSPTGPPSGSVAAAATASVAAAATASVAAAATPSVAASAAPAVAAPCTKRTLKFDPTHLDLTGAWLTDDDGIHYLREVGTTLWWNGMSGQSGAPEELGRDSDNVATGQIKPDLTIDLKWADVPRGETLGVGTLKLKVVDDGTGNAKIVKLSETGSGFGGQELTPCFPG